MLLLHFIQPVRLTGIVQNAYIIEFDQNTNNSIHQSINDELRFYKNQYELSSSSEGGTSHPIIRHLSKHPAVVSISSVSKLVQPQWFNGSPNYTFPYSNSVSQAYDVHRQLKITGEGILVGIIDSGIDYTHLALGGGLGKDYKVRYGRNLVSAKRDEKLGIKPRGEFDPYDPCTGRNTGHGTHIAGIIAGYDISKNFIGIAPNATLAVWRIFGCDQRAHDDTVIKALEMAYEAGCQVINLSLGSENGWIESPLAAAVERISKAGIIVASVAGNQGMDGPFSISSPGIAESAVSVASINSPYYPAKVFEFSTFPGEYFSYLPSTSTQSFPNGELAYVIVNGSFPYACNNDMQFLTQFSTVGKILLVKRGHCKFNEKLKNAKLLGVKGVLFYDPDTSSHDVARAKTHNGMLPCAGIEYATGNRLVTYMMQHKDVIIKLKTAEEEHIIDGGPGLRISDFSSIGPSYELHMKPIITAIGGNVYSTVPYRVNNGWSVKSGTSMASPQVAGTLALMLEYYQKTKRSVTGTFLIEQLQNHARILKKESGIPYHPLIQGSGLIQVFDAIREKVHVSPAHISFNDTASFSVYKKITLTISNENGYPLHVLFENIQSGSIQMLPANTADYQLNKAQIDDGYFHVDLQFTPSSTAVIPALASVKIDVTVLINNHMMVYYPFPMYGGFIVVKDALSKRALSSVPYFGVIGSMKDVPIFDKGYPYMASEKNITEKASFPYLFTLTRSKSRPTMVIRTMTGTARIEIRLLDKYGNPIGVIHNGVHTYKARNGLANKRYTKYKWTGDYKAICNTGKYVRKYKCDDTHEIRAKEGSYYLLLRALKHFGDPDNKDDWKEWKSGEIIVQVE
ncbi:subtilisin-like protein [Rhizopus microsporus ATCC 52813]|uniref:Subtilisin-like protein n=1 Tax=Rhizopus microsporus ATCC 52813 TaxID=1340429 RepID=A0A2G4T1I3_RHIZD|nr:subtilisin-like protein [Rhizopus microsporus ATCC 52813]PHZ14867.1 subtilisin-like protein [Rhizopus microsporus ATCC 52813]